MIKVEDFQKYGKDHYEALVASAGTLSRGFQDVAAAMTEYSKKSFEQGSAYVEKLAGVKSLDKALEVQTDFAKSSYEAFVAEATKIGEIYKDVFKEAYKPFEGAVSKLPKVA